MSLDDISTEDLLAKLTPAARRRYLDTMLGQDFTAFVRKVFETVSPVDVFLPNWHIDAMTYAAELVIAGKINRLITTVPPRHLKSVIFSVAMPAYLLGRDPTQRIICISYSNELAIKHAIDFRAVITSEWYRRVFPKTVVSREKDTQFETMTTARGFRYATSLGGTLTGRGADLIVLDDPQKPEEALSEAQRNSAGQWFDTTLLTRLDSKSKGAVVIVMQRLHEDDLAGRLLAKGRWEHLKIAAIAEPDERVAVGPGRIHERLAGSVIDLRRESFEDLERLKQSMGELFFSAQYQQEPIPLAGNLIKADWFKHYDTAPILRDSDLVVISIDTAMKGTSSADFSVATVWLVRGENSYLLDLWRERVDYPDLRRVIRRLREKYPTAIFLIEDKGSGTSLIQDLRSEDKRPFPSIPRATRLRGSRPSRFNSSRVRFGFPRTRPGSAVLRLSSSVFRTSSTTTRSIPFLRRYPGSNSAVKIRSHLWRRLSFTPPRGAYFDEISSR